MNETLNDFVISDDTNANKIGYSTFKCHINSHRNIFGRITVNENSACQNQIIENDRDEKKIKAAYSVVMTVKNWMHDAILTSMNNVLTPRIQIAVRLITESSGYWPNSVMHNTGQEDFTVITENTPLMSAY